MAAGSFTGQHRTLGPAEGAEYWTLTAANELDRIGKMPRAEGILPLLDERAAFLPAIARVTITAARVAYR